MRKIYLLTSIVIATVLFVAGIAEYKGSGASVGWRLAASACCIAGAMGVIWLSFYWLKLCGEVTSIADQLRQGRTAAAKAPILKELGETLTAYTQRKTDKELLLEQKIKELQVQLRISQGQRRNTEAIIYGIRDAVVVIDEFDKLLMANEAAEELFKFDFKSSQHKPLAEVIDPETSDFVTILHQIKLNGVRHTRRELKFAAEGRNHTFDCIVSCVYDGGPQDNTQTGDRDERVCGAVAVLHDITREKEVSQMKDDFVSYVSHELRTPLASITAYSEMLLDDEIADEKTRKEFYSVIQNQAKRLNRLIEDILNTARIESGLIKITKQPLSLTMLIEEQMQMMKSYASDKNITLSWANACRQQIIFDQVMADRDMMSQVIINLLSNAVKYTPSGGSVKVETEVDEIASVVKVSITDTGVGIPENEIGHLFSKFYRVEVNKKQAGGTGLGLTLVKQIVEKVHNGRVFVRSKPGQGSTFGFELPLANMQTANV
jgi:signal transduction histidine kinase